MVRAQGGRWAEAGLTVDSELEVLCLLARWAEGHALVPPLVPQVTAGDSKNLAVLLELDMRVSRKDRPAKMVRRTAPVRLRRWQGPAALRTSRAERFSRRELQTVHVPIDSERINQVVPTAEYYSAV